MIKKEILRIIDANFNRSREALRVCEEVARFIWNSKPLTKELKSVRHGISAIIKDAPDIAKILYGSRNIPGDIGRSRRTESEMARRDYRDIFSANMERAKESVRVLEEFFKLIDKRISARFASLRFKVYDIEKKALK